MPPTMKQVWMFARVNSTQVVAWAGITTSIAGDPPVAGSIYCQTPDATWNNVPHGNAWQEGRYILKTEDQTVTDGQLTNI